MTKYFDVENLWVSGFSPLLRRGRSAFAVMINEWVGRDDKWPIHGSQCGQKELPRVFLSRWMGGLYSFVLWTLSLPPHTAWKEEKYFLSQGDGCGLLMLCGWQIEQILNDLDRKDFVLGVSLSFKKVAECPHSRGKDEVKFSVKLLPKLR